MTVLRSILLGTLSTLSILQSSSALPFEVRSPRAQRVSYSVVNVDGSNGAAATGAISIQTVTQKVTETILATTTVYDGPAAQTVTVTRTLAGFQEIYPSSSRASLSTSTSTSTSI